MSAQESPGEPRRAQDSPGEPNRAWVNADKSQKGPSTLVSDVEEAKGEVRKNAPESKGTTGALLDALLLACLCQKTLT